MSVTGGQSVVQQFSNSRCVVKGLDRPAFRLRRNWRDACGATDLAMTPGARLAESSKQGAVGPWPIGSGDQALPPRFDLTAR